MVLTIWTRLPNGRGSASSRWFPANFSGCGSAIVRSSVARSVASLRAVEAMRTASAPGVCPVLRYSDERGGPSRALYAVGFQKNRPKKEMAPQ